MRRRLNAQLLVMVSVFFLVGCGIFRDPPQAVNPCNCVVNQETVNSSILLNEQNTQLVAIAQSFTVPSAQAIDRVTLNIGNHGNDPNQLKVTVYANLASQNVPNLALVLGTSASVAVTPNSVNWVSFCWNAFCSGATVSLQPNVIYWMAVSRNDGLNIVSPSQYFNVYGDGSGSYVGGQIKVLNQNALSNWVSYDGLNHLFTLFSLAFRIGCSTIGGGCG